MNGSVRVVGENTVTNLENLSSPEIMDQWKRQRRKTNAGKRNTLSLSSTESLEDSEQSGMLQMFNVEKKILVFHKFSLYLQNSEFFQLNIITSC